MKVNQCDVCHRVLGTNEDFIEMKINLINQSKNYKGADRNLLILDICDECIHRGFKIISTKFKDQNSYLLLIDEKK